MSSKTAADGRRRGWSLALLLGAVHGVTAFLLVLVTALSLLWAVERAVEHEDRGLLEGYAQHVADLLQRRPDDVDELRREVRSLGGPSSRMLVRVTDSGMRVMAETSGMPSLSDVPAGPHAIVAVGERTFFVVIREVDLPRSSITVALDRSSEEEFLADIRRRMLGIVALAAVVSLGLGLFAARLGTAPIASMVATARRIGGSTTTLGQRIEVRTFPAELGALAATFNAMLQRIEELVNRLRQFSADVAHELRTPLCSLQGGLEVAVRDGDPGGLRDAAASALEECQRLSQLVERLLFLARTDDPLDGDELQLVPLESLLEGVVDLYCASAHERGIALRLVGDDGLDRGLIQRAVGNLVENALRHTSVGGSIEVSARARDRAARIEVADTGCGIAAEHLPRIFDRLYRADTAQAARDGGAGLGLAIVRRIASMHGGTVEAESTLGVGTKVSIVSPLRTERGEGDGAEAPALQ
jgi:two-component system, OmpR family, heavy metal sensor histidine kinase CusS